jgi:hypothetical protein
MDEQVTRVLILEESPAVTDELLDVIRDRTSHGPTHFHVVVPNPAAHEINVVHPRRHLMAAQAERTLRDALPQLEAAAGGPVTGTVSIRHDPMDAVEDVLFTEPVDEVIVSTTTHAVARWLHQDLASRLRHRGYAVTNLAEHAPA